MIVADFDTPIIGLEFLSFYELLVDAKNNRLIDSTKSIATSGQAVFGNYASIKTIVGTTNYHRILADFLTSRDRLVSREIL